MPSTYQLKVFENDDALDKAAAEFIIAVAKEAIAKSGKFVIALSGGQTPLNLFAMLAEPFYADQINWKKTFVFWGDERCVSLNDTRNNAFIAKKILLAKINIPSENIFPIPVNLPPAEAAETYQNEIKDFFGNAPIIFDLILLGLGNNGHTASLFPDTNVLDEKAIGIKQVYIPAQKMFRITMTAPLINQAKNILFIVKGKEKAAILNKVFTSPKQPHKYPAQLIEPNNGKLWWFVDKKAALLF